MKIDKFTPVTRRILSLLFVSSTLSGCATTPTAQNHNDPWEGWNRGVHGFNKDFDDTILKPLAKGYDNVVPNPVDESITNVFSNINDIGVTINDFLQFKFVQGGMDASRFLINTTAGLVGIFDVAKLIDLPKHDEDFGQTLGFWGVPSGNYMVLPFIGASSPREAMGLIGDALFNPLTYVSFFGGFAANAATAAATGVDVTDTRSDLMQSEKIIDEASVDRYDFVKNAYIQRRDYLVHDGNPPEDNNDPLLGQGDNIGNQAITTPATGTAQGLMSAPASTRTTPIPGSAVSQNPNAVPIINNSTTLPKDEPKSQAPVIDNSKHILEITAPDD
jgi:phospholipid-binding lipoprotein MlaA